MTPFAHHTNAELISMAYTSLDATPLELEFAFRLENNYPDDVRVMPDELGEEEPVVIEFEDTQLATNARG